MTRRDAEGGREALHARRDPPGRRERGRRRVVSGARAARATRATCSSTLDVDAIRARGFRIVVDYGFSAASYVLPLVLGPLGVEVVAAHAFPSDGDAEARTASRASIGQAKRLVSAVGADLGAVFDRAGERLYLIDEQAREVSVEQALLLYLQPDRSARTATTASSRSRSRSRARSTGSSRAPASRSCARRVAARR